MHILVTGATGLVGAEVIRLAIVDDDIRQVTALVRRPLAIQHPKLTTHEHPNFLDYSSLSPQLKTVDVCLWCLGVSQSQVNEQEYYTITHDYAVAATNALLEANPNVTFLFLSGGGADSSEQSRTLFARIKGKTENSLKRLPLKRLIIARPAGIKPINKNPNAPLAYKIMNPFYPLMELIAPNQVISSVDLAKALLHLVKQGSEKTILENVDLKRIAATL
ncbi:MAG: NAD(P)H-binding protein [Ignavibacteriae bacterium]|nr:NAD(P)H-binding protein [Ignavibacteriota bacterium]